MPDTPPPFTFAYDLRLAEPDEVDAFFEDLAANGQTPEQVAEHRRRFLDSTRWIAAYMDCRIGHAHEAHNLEYDEGVVWCRTDTDIDQFANEQAELALDQYLKAIRSADEIDVWPDDLKPRDMAVQVHAELRAALRSSES